MISRQKTMFTGLIEQKASVVAWEHAAGTIARLVVVPEHPFAADLGESIALNGVCLTVVSQDHDLLAFDVGAETLACTTFSELKVGAALNLERALCIGARLGGHIVSGHVDTTGHVGRIEKNSDGWVYEVLIPKEFAAQVIKKGSIAIDGVSLTINTVSDGPEHTAITVCIIPKTLEVTNLSLLSVGDRVNIETDIIGKYALRKDTGTAI